MIHFKTFTKKFIKEDSAIGDLARDIGSDQEFPRKNDHDTILDHLESKNAIPDAISTFEKAWKEYQSQCPEYDGNHQYAVLQIDPPRSECQNCGLIVDSLEGLWRLNHD